MGKKTSGRLPFVQLLWALTLLLLLPAKADGASRPKIVVGIIVEGLDMNMIEDLEGLLTDNGLKRLIRQGLTVESIDFGPGLDAVAGTAVLMTGSWPVTNGIPGKTIYNLADKTNKLTLADTTQLGNYTTEQLSPGALAVSTIGDEFRIASSGIGSHHAIAADPSISILLGGHAANSAFWINDIDGRWSTTTYYKEVPQAINAANYRRPLSVMLDTMSWRPLLTGDKYPDLPDFRTQYGFRHSFPRKEVNRYRDFKTTPIANSYIMDMAYEFIETLKLGGREASDMLLIGLSLEPFTAGKESDNRMQSIDSYFRLDRDIEKLMKELDKRFGADGWGLFVAGVPTSATGRKDDEKFRIPHGIFSTTKARSLLNMYLMALHGNGEYIDAFNDKHLYLNHKTISNSGADLTTVRSEAAAFLTKMSGVAQAFTIDDILAGRVGENPEALRRNTDPSSAGDIILELRPGWSWDADKNDNSPSVYRKSAIATPLFVICHGIKPQKIGGQTEASSVAPTLGRIFRFRTPNSSSSAPLIYEKLENKR